MVSLCSLAASILPLASMAAALPLEDGGVGINIIGGTTADISEFPYIVNLVTERGFSHFCGGVLLNANTVLTAGHCSEGRHASAVLVHLGSAIRNVGGWAFGVPSIKIHSDYSKNFPYNNDIAIWKLSQTMPEKFPVKYATLPAQGSDPSAGTSVTVAGWGLTTEGGTVVSKLRKVTVSVIPRDTCRSQYDTSLISDAMWCAGDTGGGKDACQGDSGGPIVDSSGTLLGVVSWGFGCGRKEYPGVYTRVGSFVDWINQFLDASEL